MAELDRSRGLTFLRGTMTAADGTPGLGISIPIAGMTRTWSTEFTRLARDQHLDARANGDDLMLLLPPGTSPEDVARKLDLTVDLVDQANRAELDRLDATSASLEPLEAAARAWWQQG